MIPVISLEKPGAAEAIGKACRDHGFFYIAGHGVPEKLQNDLVRVSHKFFSLPESEKLQIPMSLGGKAWRGYFPVGGELTSGKPDRKEGLYLGSELPNENSLVQAGVPLHGPNLFPSQLPELKPLVLEYMDHLTKLGHRLMGELALSLGLEKDYFYDHYTKDPLILFRIFHYPVESKAMSDSWGVGEHTDYGVLTILKQDDVPGLEVKTKAGWLAAPPIPDTFVCNIGDMLDRLTGGIYRSTPHRVKNTSGKNRISLPFFFDPNLKAEIKALPLTEKPTDDKDTRWDKTSVHTFQGTYQDYLLKKIGRVFPDLIKKVL